MSAMVSRQASEDVIINSPMSFAGAAQRSFRIRRRANGNAVELAALTILAVLLVTVWWAAVTVWYVFAVGMLGIVTIPFRILRRGARKRKAEALRHREMMAAIQHQKQQQP